MKPQGLPAAAHFPPLHLSVAGPSQTAPPAGAMQSNAQACGDISHLNSHILLPDPNRLIIHTVTDPTGAE